MKILGNAIANEKYLENGELRFVGKNSSHDSIMWKMSINKENIKLFLENLFASGFNLDKIITKQRTIFEYNNTKIKLDKVDNLGINLLINISPDGTGKIDDKTKFLITEMMKKEK